MRKWEKELSEFAALGRPLWRLAGTSISRLNRIVFPPACLGCGVDLDEADLPANVGLLEVRDRAISVKTSAGSFNQYWFQNWQSTNWCEACWRQAAAKSVDRCRRCGALLFRANPLRGSCQHCHGEEFHFDQAFAVNGYHGLFRELVTRMKNQKDDHLAIHLGNLLGSELCLNGWHEFDLILPVPQPWLRRLKRGFQATEILAERVAQLTGIPQSSKVIRATRNSAKQGTLSVTARQSNVRNAFGLYSAQAVSKVKGQRILVIDDVMTTGATLSEIARMLKRQQAAAVSVAVVARGGGNN